MRPMLVILDMFTIGQWFIATRRIPTVTVLDIGQQVSKLPTRSICHMRMGMQWSSWKVWRLRVRRSFHISSARYHLHPQESTVWVCYGWSICGSLSPLRGRESEAQTDGTYCPILSLPEFHHSDPSGGSWWATCSLCGCQGPNSALHSKWERYLSAK